MATVLGMACTQTSADKPAKSTANSTQARNNRVPAVMRITAGKADDTPAGDTLTIAMTGDVMMGTTWPTRRLPAADGQNLFKDARKHLSRANLALGNLEGALADTGQTVKKGKANNYAFRTPTGYARLLKQAGYDFMALANNHSMDFGLPGLITTELALRGQGIAYAGVRGRTEMAVIERGGVRYGVCAFGHNSYTLSHNNAPEVRRVIEGLKKEADIIIVSMHGGAEGKAYSHLPEGKEEYLKEDRGSLREFAHLCIDLGADLVYGHGPHVTRCMELYRGRLIAYSLGNFCTPYGINTTGTSGLAPILTARIGRDGRFISGTIHSMRQQYGQGPRTDRTHAAAREMARLTAEDISNGRLRISSKGEVTVR